MKEISLGNNYFEIGLLLRDSNLVNGILFNSEAWYDVTKKQNEKLEKIDEMYLRTLLEAHSKTPVEALYIETGKIQLRFILQKKRLMDWHHIVNQKEDSLLHKFYKAQKNELVKGDWVNTLEEDKADFQIELNDDEMKTITKNSVKKIVKQKGK